MKIQSSRKIVLMLAAALAVMTGFACDDADARIYLTETVEPCSVKLVEDVEPCSPLADGYFATPFPGDLHGLRYPIIDPELMADPLAHYLHHSVISAGSSHILVRGFFIPGTIRCVEVEESAVRMAGFIQLYFDRSTLLPCFADFAASEYMYGSGPPRITLNISQRSVSSFGTADKLERLVENHYAANTAGRERVYGLRPSYSNIAVEAWRTAHRWDVYKDQCGEPVVADLDSLEYVVTYAPDATREERGRFVWTLGEFKKDAERVMTSYAERSLGKIWYDPSPSQIPVEGLEAPPRLMTDVHDLHAHYRDELLAYSGPAATPVVPERAPGQPHSYPRPPSPRPSSPESPYDPRLLPRSDDHVFFETSQADEPCLPDTWVANTRLRGYSVADGSVSPAPSRPLSNSTIAHPST